MGRIDERIVKPKQLVSAALGAVLIVICSWITVPTIIPFTLQTLAIFLLLHLLGGKIGLLSIVVYILLGIVGLPVFAGFNTGIGCLMGPTGGFVIGFVFMALTYCLATKYFGYGQMVKLVALIAGLLICYGLGTAWFVMVYSKGTQSITISAALSLCVFPFVIPDLIKLFVAMGISKCLSKRIGSI